jgi:hypothetical protein
MKFAEISQADIQNTSNSYAVTIGVNYGKLAFILWAESEGKAAVSSIILQNHEVGVLLDSPSAVPGRTR